MTTEERQANLRGMVKEVEEWFASYMAFPDPDLALVVALWSVGTWVFNHLYVYPYLVITARTKGAGKTTLLKLVARIALNGWLTTAATPPNILQRLKDKDGLMTLCFDEAETTSSEAKSFMSQVLNSGYEAGSTIARMRGTTQVIYPSYCPKAFSMIGSTASTVQDRSVIAVLERKNAPRDLMPWIADDEANILRTKIQRTIETCLLKSDIKHVMPDHLETRDRQIWSALFGLAHAFALPSSAVGRLVRFSADNCEFKRGPKLAALDEDAEKDANLRMYARKALADTLRVLRDGEKTIFSAVLVERLKSLNDAPWRVYQGNGLDQILLSHLLAKAGIAPTTVRQQGAGREGKPAKGYKVAELRKAAGADV